MARQGLLVLLAIVCTSKAERVTAHLAAGSTSFALEQGMTKHRKDVNTQVKEMNEVDDVNATIKLGYITNKFVGNLAPSQLLDCHVHQSQSNTCWAANGQQLVSLMRRLYPFWGFPQITEQQIHQRAAANVQGLSGNVGGDVQDLRRALRQLGFLAPPQYDFWQSPFGPVPNAELLKSKIDDDLPMIVNTNDGVYQHWRTLVGYAENEHGVMQYFIELNTALTTPALAQFGFQSIGDLTSWYSPKACVKTQTCWETLD